MISTLNNKAPQQGTFITGHTLGQQILPLDIQLQQPLNFCLTAQLNQKAMSICQPPGLHSFRPKSNSISLSTCSGSRKEKEDSDDDFSDSEFSLSTKSKTQAADIITSSDKKYERKDSSNSDSNKSNNSNAETYMKKYKTELCKNFEMRGFCKWGSKCCFAHGAHELRKKKHLNNQYKSKICKHYHRHGYCPYGLRCQYFHIKDNYDEFLTAFVEKFQLKKNEMESDKNDVKNVMENLTKL